MMLLLKAFFVWSKIIFESKVLNLKSLFIAFLLSTPLLASESVEKEIVRAVKLNAKYMTEESVEKTMTTIHKQSQSYLPTQNMLPSIFDNYKLSYEFMAIDFIAHKDELAYVRVKQLTKKIEGAAFRNNIIDMLQVFKLEGETWKLWSQANMSVEYLN